MELKELMERISKNDIPHFLILFGEEQGILDVYLDELKGFAQHISTSFQSVMEVYGRRGIKSLDSSSKLYVINRDDSYKQMESKWEDVSNYFSKSKDIVILKYDKLKKNEKFYTRNKKYCVEFKPLTDEILYQHIFKTVPINSDIGYKLIHYCNNDYGRLLLELDKLKHYMISSKERDPDKAFDIMDEHNAFYKEIGDITFELTDAVLYGDIDKSFRKLDEAKRKGESPMLIASVLYNGFRNMLAVQALGKNKKDASKRTGLQGWEVHNAIKNMGAYSVKTLERNIKLCQKVETGVKTGKISDTIALDYLIQGCLI